MTPEQLDMHKRLQPFYKRTMGEWQAGDRAYRIATVFGEPLDSQIWPDDKRSEIVSIDSKSSIKSYWHCKNEKGEERLLTDDDLLSTTCLRCPLAIDSEHPERGLWGMLNWIEVCVSIWGDGKVSLGEDSFQEDVTKTDPTTAILKALCEQEGV